MAKKYEYSSVPALNTIVKKSEHSLVPVLGSTPWIILIHGRHQQIQTFYNPLDGSLHHRSIPEMRKKVCFGCSNGYLMLADMDYSDSYLLNLITMAVISLPRLTPSFSNYRFFFLLSSSPSRVDCTVVVIKHVHHNEYEERAGEIMICRLGDEEWKLLYKAYVRDVGGINNGIVKSTGDIYLHGAYNKLIVIDPKSLIVRLIDAETIERMGDYFQSRQILLESDGELFVVSVYLHYPFKFMCADIYTALEWERVKSIGENRAIFLGSFNDGGGSVDGYMVDDPRVKSDNVYFVKPSYDGMRMYRFSPSEGEIIYHKLICPKVGETWFTKSCYLAMASD